MYFLCLHDCVPCRSIYYEIIYQKYNFLKSSFYLGLLLKSQKKVSNQTKQNLKKTNNATQNDQDNEEEYDPVLFELTDIAEIASLEEVFTDIQVFLCDFHREQSWLR